jgi:predicted HTH transcriptional regulator
MIPDLTHLIEYENENTALDFKLTEYLKPKTLDLIKDVMSMANAYLTNDRYIIIGMKPDAENRNIGGITTVSDPANIQQTILENVEPEINVEYFPYKYEGYQLGILRIYNCDARPYLMKKNFIGGTGKGLMKGDGYIRMGTTQMRLNRSHFEQIYAQRFKNDKFSGKLEVSFDRSRLLDLIEISPFNGEVTICHLLLRRVKLRKSFV